MYLEYSVRLKTVSDLKYIYVSLILTNLNKVASQAVPQGYTI